MYRTSWTAWKSLLLSLANSSTTAAAVNSRRCFLSYSVLTWNAVVPQKPKHFPSGKFFFFWDGKVFSFFLFFHFFFKFDVGETLSQKSRRCFLSYSVLTWNAVVPQKHFSIWKLFYFFFGKGRFFSFFCFFIFFLNLMLEKRSRKRADGVFLVTAFWHETLSCRKKPKHFASRKFWFLIFFFCFVKICKISFCILIVLVFSFVLVFLFFSFQIWFWRNAFVKEPTVFS